MEQVLNLANRPALVTGAGQGIGRSIALSLAAHNAGGVIVNDFYKERADTVAGEIRQMGGRALPVAADVTDPEAVANMVERGVAEFGDLGVLVNNAGNAGVSSSGFTNENFWELPVSDWEKWLAVNLYGVMNCCHAAVPSLISHGRGRIITLISDAARTGEPGLECYAAAKAGAAGFLRSLARSVGRHLITVNMISMGATITPTSSDSLIDVDTSEKILKSYVIRRFGTPEDAAGLAVFLASDAAGWITGQTIPVNGGYSFAL